jgi:hypothetical protein
MITKHVPQWTAILGTKITAGNTGVWIAYNDGAVVNGARAVMVRCIAGAFATVGVRPVGNAVDYSYTMAQANDMIVPLGTASHYEYWDGNILTTYQVVAYLI